MGNQVDAIDVEFNGITGSIKTEFKNQGSCIWSVMTPTLMINACSVFVLNHDRLVYDVFFKPWKFFRILNSELSPMEKKAQNYLLNP